MFLKEIGSTCQNILLNIPGKKEIVNEKGEEHLTEYEIRFVSVLLRVLVTLISTRAISRNSLRFVLSGSTICQGQKYERLLFKNPDCTL